MRECVYSLSILDMLFIILAIIAKDALKTASRPARESAWTRLSRCTSSPWKQVVDLAAEGTPTNHVKSRKEPVAKIDTDFGHTLSNFDSTCDGPNIMLPGGD